MASLLQRLALARAVQFEISSGPAYWWLIRSGPPFGRSRRSVAQDRRAAAKRLGQA